MGTGKTTADVNLDSRGHSGLGFGVAAESVSDIAHQVFRQARGEVLASILASSFASVDVPPADREFSIHAIRR